MKLIVGLGNPGREYRETRHNVGFMVVEEIARRHGIDWASGPSQIAETLIGKRFGDEPLMVAKPLTYMNNSGDAVGGLVRYFNVTPDDLIVVSTKPHCRLESYGHGPADRRAGTTVSSRSSSGWGPRNSPGFGWESGAETAGAIWPIMCSHGSSEANRPSSKRSSRGRRMPPRCLPRKASRNVMNVYNPDAPASDVD
jgi:hypothetical protein